MASFCLPLQRVIVYPDYINAVKTVAEGRRVAKDKGRRTVDCGIDIAVIIPLKTTGSPLDGP